MKWLHLIRYHLIQTLLPVLLLCCFTHTHAQPAPQHYPGHLADQLEVARNEGGKKGFSRFADSLFLDSYVSGKYEQALLLNELILEQYPDDLSERQLGICLMRTGILHYQLGGASKAFDYYQLADRLCPARFAQYKSWRAERLLQKRRASTRLLL